MSTSVIKARKHSRVAGRSALVYLAAAAFCVIIDRIYSLYGHGVESNAMMLMFLYPLVGGSLVYALLWGFIPDAEQVPGFRFFRNNYNSGIATLTVSSALCGVFEIAGTSSSYTLVLTVCGILFCAVGLIGYLAGLIRMRRAE